MERVNVEGLAKLPAFRHATVAGDFVFVSGSLGTKPDSMELVDGGVGPQTEQTLRNIEQILDACGTGLDDVAKVSVFVADLDSFGEMNAAHMRCERGWGWSAKLRDPPKRGCPVWRLAVGCRRIRTLRRCGNAYGPVRAER